MELDGAVKGLDQHDQFVSFWVDGQLLGVPVHSVQEVLNPQTITRTPLARPEIAGLLNLRGQIVTAVNLRKRLGLEDPNDTHECVNIVIRHKDESFSLLADEVGDVIETTGIRMEPVPHTLDEHWKQLMQGIFRLDGRLFVILNIPAVLKMD
ncbi:MAG: chemotaxis protein CheW [Planctomycetaceae bacterium]|nr:chemotaxis protein CheW [Planctomycetaceae bacterium]